jgi:hypothetical protein
MSLNAINRAVAVDSSIFQGEHISLVGFNREGTVKTRPAINNGTSRPLSDFYGTLGAAQSAYPNAEILDLTEELARAVVAQAIYSTTVRGQRLFIPPGVYPGIKNVQLPIGTRMFSTGKAFGPESCSATFVGVSGQDMFLFPIDNSGAEAPGFYTFAHIDLAGLRFSGGLNQIYAPNGADWVHLRDLTFVSPENAGIYTRGFNQEWFGRDITFSGGAYGFYLPYENSVPGGYYPFMDKSFFESIYCNGQSENGIHVSVRLSTAVTWKDIRIVTCAKTGMHVAGGARFWTFINLSTEANGYVGGAYGSTVGNFYPGETTINVLSTDGLAVGQFITIEGAGVDGSDACVTILGISGFDLSVTPAGITGVAGAPVYTTKYVKTIGNTTSGSPTFDVLSTSGIAVGSFLTVKGAGVGGSDWSGTVISIAGANITLDSNAGRTTTQTEVDTCPYSNIEVVAGPGGDAPSAFTFIDCSMTYTPTTAGVRYGADFTGASQKQPFTWIGGFSFPRPIYDPVGALQGFLSDAVKVRRYVVEFDSLYGTQLGAAGSRTQISSGRGQDIVLGLQDSLGNQTGTFGNLECRVSDPSRTRVLLLDASGNLTIAGVLNADGLNVDHIDSHYFKSTQTLGAGNKRFVIYDDGTNGAGISFDSSVLTHFRTTGAWVWEIMVPTGLWVGSPNELARLDTVGNYSVRRVQLTDPTLDDATARLAIYDDGGNISYVAFTAAVLTKFRSTGAWKFEQTLTSSRKGTASVTPLVIDGDGITITGFKMVPGSVDGYVLTSDSAGIGTWKSSTEILTLTAAPNVAPGRAAPVGTFGRYAASPNGDDIFWRKAGVGNTDWIPENRHDSIAGSTAPGMNIGNSLGIGSGVAADNIDGHLQVGTWIGVNSARTSGAGIDCGTPVYFGDVHSTGDVTLTAKTANKIVTTDGSKNLDTSVSTTIAELGYLSGVTSNIQTQLDALTAALALKSTLHHTHAVTLAIGTLSTTCPAGSGSTSASTSSGTTDPD